MDMAHSLFIYEALTQVGVQPDMAHRVEREIQHGLTVAHDAAFERKVHHLLDREEFHQKIAGLVTR